MLPELTQLIRDNSALVEQNFFFNRLLGDRLQLPVENTLDGLASLHNLTLDQLRDLHSDLSRTIWNSQPWNIEQRDIMIGGSGGLMWGGLRQYTDNIDWVDLERGETFRNRDDEYQNRARLHIVPFGIDHHIKSPRLTRASASLIGIDMWRFVDSVTSYSVFPKGDSIHVLHGDLSFNAARLLHSQLGFRITHIADKTRATYEFNGWSALSKIQNQLNSTICSDGTPNEVVVSMFATRDDLRGKVWEEANKLLARIFESEKITTTAAAIDFESKLRMLAIAIYLSKNKLKDSRELEKWLEIYRPGHQIPNRHD